ncbi:MAG: prephenate dehydratase [Candidatus Omnitrophica bacterium]|nr:prephenate dehydratase [Candidatus Omnitrophota bacterium]MBD3269789.1 prephenate dehydratase [Candidatus Omnitrophota bacterium]
MELKKLREDIDKIDNQILNLLNRRVNKVLKVSKLKQKKSISSYAPEREAKILRRLRALNKGPLSKKDLENIFREILSSCRSQRSLLKIAYLGPQGTFTHLAALKKFGRKSDYIVAESIEDVFDKVERDESDYGVVPIENSTEGAINYTLDMFLVSSLNICAEVVIDVSHSLLGSRGRKIKRIYSNPEVFAQCRKWISGSLKEAELISTASTAVAARKTKSDKQGACIGNKILADIYGLKVLASPVEDSTSNFTRFLIISKNDSPPSGKDKTSILFSVKDRVGVLYETLSAFRKNNVNLTKIESRPSKIKPWEYYFFLDLEGHRVSPSIQRSLKSLEKICVFLKILGSYPRES